MDEISNIQIGDNTLGLKDEISRKKVNSVEEQLSINVKDLGVDSSGEIDIVPYMNIKSNTQYYFPDGDYKIDSFRMYSNLENITFIFSNNARLKDTCNVQVLGMDYNEVEMYGGVPNGIIFKHCKNLKFNGMKIYNPRDVGSIMIHREYWHLRKSNFEFDSVDGLEIDVMFDGWIGGLISLGEYDIETLENEIESVYRSSFIYIKDSKNIKSKYKINNDSAGGEPVWLFNCENIILHDLSNVGVSGSDFYSLVKAHKCKNMIIKDISNIRHKTAASIIEVNGENIVIENVNFDDTKGHIIDISKEGSTKSGNCDNIIIRNINRDKELGYSVVTTQYVETDDGSAEMLDNVIDVNNVFLENINVKNMVHASLFAFDLRSIRNTYMRDINVTDCNVLFNFNKETWRTNILNNVTINNLNYRFEKHKAYVDGNIQTHGKTLITNSTIMGAEGRTGEQNLGLTDMTNYNENSAYLSPASIVFENTVFKRLRLGCMANLKFINCEFEDVVFISNSTHDIVFDGCNIKYSLSDNRFGKIPMSFEVCNEIKFNNVHLQANIEIVASSYMVGVTNVKSFKINNSTIDMNRYVGGVRQLISDRGFIGASKTTKIELFNSSFMDAIVSSSGLENINVFSKGCVYNVNDGRTVPLKSDTYATGKALIEAYGNVFPTSQQAKFTELGSVEANNIFR